jgi:hypothetical protein
MSATWKRDLRYGVGEATAEGSGGLITWRDPAGPTPAYLKSECGIHGTVLPEEGDEAIALTLYPVQESPDTIMGVQFRIRALTDGRLDLLEHAIATIWTDRWGGTLRGIRLVGSSWASGADLGTDQNGRLVRSVNYYLRVERPLPHRTT